MTRRALFTLFLLLGLTACASDPILFEFRPRTENQMDSFYIARGFPEDMRKIIREHCMITTGITNISDDIVWMEKHRWHFEVDGEPVKLKTRTEWRQFWEERGAPGNAIATFHWTQIPDALDYLPGEREGGNVTLPRTDKPITFRASFLTGKDKQGDVFEYETTLHCAFDKDLKPETAAQ